MSIVVAVKKNNEIAVAADSQNNFGSLIVTPANHSAQKIRQIGDVFFASTGWGVYENIIDDILIRHKKDVKLQTKSDIFNFFQNLWRDMHENYSFVNDQCHDEDSPFGDLDASFMLVNKYGIFNVASDTSVTEFHQYYAIGSGSDFGLGTLYALYDMDLTAEVIASKAVEAANAFNVYCGGEIKIYKIKIA